jgi:hypothetical protein
MQYHDIHHIFMKLVHQITRGMEYLFALRSNYMITILSGFPWPINVNTDNNFRITLYLKDDHGKNEIISRQVKGFEETRSW